MYSKELIAAVREVYPDSPKMHEFADSGNVFLGRYLDDSSQNYIQINDILLATNLEDLQRKARLIKRKVEVYQMWCKEDPRQKIGY